MLHTESSHKKPYLRDRYRLWIQPVGATQELDKTLTWEMGKEMAVHACFTLTTDIKVYFCEPQKPWQRGTIVKTNGLPGQYLPKGIDLSIDSQTQLDDIARVFHQRTRNTLNYETPAQRCGQSVASTD